MPRRTAVWVDAQVVANNHQMAAARAGAVVAIQHERHAAKTGDASNVLHQRPGCVADRHRSSEALEQLQQNQESELRGRPSGAPSGQAQFVACRRKRSVKVAGAEHALEPRVGGVLEAGHGAPGCQRMCFLWHHKI